MAFRWSKGISPLQTIKRGLTSLFVCAVVLLPLVFTVIQVKGWLGIKSDGRTTKPLAAMQVRSIDKTSDPVKPFDQPLITVTFDDGWESTYTEALPVLQKYGIPTTQYVLSGTSKDTNYMSFQQMVNAKNAGHQIACHSIDHADLTKLDLLGLAKELTTCRSVIQERVGGTVDDFASPYGASTPTTISAIRQNYRSHRNTDGDITNGISKFDVNVKGHFDRYDIIGVTVRRDTTDAQIQAAIDFAVQNNGWLVLTYHQVDEGESQFGLDTTLMDQQFKLISKANARIVTMDQVLKAMGY
jgi:peptidoglycan/xylan/chitin deacetylase (PgdA/CDA1 family)